MTKPLVLIDRDGTLITEQDYLKDPRKVKLLPGVVPALKSLARAGFPLVVISNQSGVGRGLMRRADVQRVNARLGTLLASQGVKLSGIYWCPHHPQIKCACRKPGLALVRKAAKDLRRSYRGSISVGDKWIDVQLGRKTGGRGILVLTGYGRQSQRAGAGAADFVARSLRQAARWILKTTREENPHDD